MTEVVSKKFVVRDWMSSEVFEYDEYLEALKKYNELRYCKTSLEIDIQIYQIIFEYNNID